MKKLFFICSCFCVFGNNYGMKRSPEKQLQKDVSSKQEPTIYATMVEYAEFLCSRPLTIDEKTVFLDKATGLQNIEDAKVAVDRWRQQQQFNYYIKSQDQPKYGQIFH